MIQEIAPEDSKFNREQKDPQETEQDLDLEIELGYRTWRKNAPYLYNTIITQSLTWPSLTVEWLPEQQLYKADGFGMNRVLYATNTSGEEDDYVIVGKVKLPYHCEVQQSESKSEKNETSNPVIGLTAEKTEPKVQIYSMIKHDGQINRARYNPFNSKTIATKSSDSNLYIYNYIQHSKEGVPNPNSIKLTLTGHQDQGFGISWNPFKNGQIVSGSNDGKVLMWDINEPETTRVRPAASFKGHTAAVNDVAFHKIWSDMFASADDDGNIFFWDVRNFNKYPLSGSHGKGEIYTLAFSKADPTKYASGGSQGIVNVWDMRMQRDPYEALTQHTKSITKIQFSPSNSSVLWSSSSDSKLIKWDLVEDQQNTPNLSTPEKTSIDQYGRFVHGGHRRPITDFNIHPNDQNLLVSVDENNQLHMFDPVD